MSKLRSQKNRKHLITLVCLLVGMLVLTTAVYANSDDAKGYSNLKEAIKKLAFYEDNFTLDGEMNFAMDSKTFTSAKVSQIQDGDNSATITNNENGYSFESYTLDGKRFYYYPDENRYSSSTANSSGKPDIKDPMVKKTVSFVELLGDTLVGDLKNNVVNVGGENGSKDYTVNISGSQIPEVVNAGLSLMMSGAQSNSPEKPSKFVAYENYIMATEAFYEKETGKSFSEEEYHNGSLDIADLEITMREQYDGIIESNGGKGILFVKPDGSHEYYATYDEFTKERMAYAVDSGAVFNMLGEDPYIDSVLCDFSIDKNGNLSSLNLKAVMSGKDDAGKKHSASMEIKGTVKDYGSSKVVLPDFSNVKNAND